MAKLLILVALCGAAANGWARSQSQPPLLIDSQAPAPSLDASR